MKNFFGLLLIAAFISGCQPKSSPVTSAEQSASGNVALTFDKVNAPAAVQTLTAVLSRSGFPSFEKSLNIVSDTSASIIFEKVVVGTWNVKVDAKDGSGVILYSGQSEVIVLENAIAQLNLALVPVSSGVGSVQINVTWGTGTPTLFPKTYGGPQRDAASCVIQTKDGGYAIGGGSYSYGSGGDAWLVKTNANGVMQWQKNYGGSGEDRINSVVQTDDGGYLCAGYRNSNGEDSWIVKFDSTGAVVWEKNYGKNGSDAFMIMKKLSDGSYLTCGYEFDGTYYDGRLVKFTPSGDLVWEKTFGGTGGDFTHDFIEQKNGQIFVSGYYGSNISNHYDFWLIKLDAAGNTLWDKRYGSTSEERSTGLVQLANGSFLLSGYIVSNEKQDGYLMNIDSSGSLLWTKAYDMGANDFLVRLQRMQNNSIIATGYTNTSAQGYQGVIMKLDNNGNAGWIKTYGGSGYEIFIEHRVLTDGKIVVAGTTSSAGNGGEDFWLVKVDGNGVMQ